MRKFKNATGLLLLGLFLSLPLLSAAQTKVTGTVTDSMNAPVVGATVNVKETGAGAKTAADGQFTITVSQGQTLVISFVGYKTREVSVTSTTAPLSK